MERPLDIIIWGATGFTGKLCVKYLAEKYGCNKTVKWAVAGRSREKLQQVLLETTARTNVPLDKIEIHVADINDRAGLMRVTAKTKVLISTAGPFAKIGTPVVDACCRSGTSYVDITGEPQWVRTLIDSYQDMAVSQKIKIIPCCGFDCIPVDMGCRALVDSMLQRGLVPTTARTVVCKMNGGGSGGTFASVFNIFESLSVAQLVETLNPYYLCPRDAFNKIAQPASAWVRFQAGDRFLPFYDSICKRWCMPFVMQAIDTRVVNRSNALSGWRYGRDFVYSEGMAVPLVGALASALLTPLFGALMLLSFARNIIKAFLPPPGSGPSEEAQAAGYFHMKLWGTGRDRNGKEVTVQGRLDAPNGDPGYKQTAVMVCEAGVCLALDGDKSPKVYGLLTPSTGLGEPLRERLEAANIKISID